MQLPYIQNIKKKLLGKTILATIFIITLFTHCSDDLPKDECILEVIKKRNMVPYRGQPVDCLNRLDMYSYRDELYFQEGNNCAYTIQNPFNCEGEYICLNLDSSQCQDFMENRTFIKIVAISSEPNTQ